MLFRSEWEFKAALAVIDLRIRYNLTQEQLAKKAGIPQSTVARIESMTLSPTVRTLAKLAQAVGADLSIDFPATRAQRSKPRVRSRGTPLTAKQVS